MRMVAATLLGSLVFAALCSGSSGAVLDATATTSGVRAKRFAARLAALGPRPAGSATERRAGLLVQHELRRVGLRPLVQTFDLPRGGRSRNIVALTGRPVRAIVVAHLDGVGEGPAANDNGSGIGALLEVARAVRGRRGVLLAALGAEERVETGSHLHLGSARLMQGISTRGRARARVAVSLDMVGVGPTLNVRGLEPRPNRSARLVLAQSRRRGAGATYYADTGQSDHAELTRGGLPAAWIEWRWDTCWHRACDTAHRLDTRKLEVAARLAIDSVVAVTAPP